jgi:hypothetical protein
MTKFPIDGFNSSVARACIRLASMPNLASARKLARVTNNGQCLVGQPRIRASSEAAGGMGGRFVLELRSCAFCCADASRYLYGAFYTLNR